MSSTNTALSRANDMSATREELHLQKCQYGVPCATAYQDGYIANCGEIAVAKWTWSEGCGSLFVCARHDALIEEKEP